jgi:HEAT repeat protein
MKSLDNIWQEYLDDTLDKQVLKDFIWHIENDDSSEAVIMATDMLVEEPNNEILKELIPYLAKQLDHEDEYVREIAVGCVVRRMELTEYAKKALNMAKNDPYDNVRCLAAASLGAVIDKVDFVLRKQIAIYLYDSITNHIYDDLHKQCTYASILEAMNVPINMWPAVKLNPDISKMVDKNLLESFRKKYNIDDMTYQ